MDSQLNYDTNSGATSRGLSGNSHKNGAELGNGPRKSLLRSIDASHGTSPGFPAPADGRIPGAPIPVSCSAQRPSEKSTLCELIRLSPHGEARSFALRGPQSPYPLTALVFSLLKNICFGTQGRLISQREKETNEEGDGHPISFTLALVVLGLCGCRSVEKSSTLNPTKISPHGEARSFALQWPQSPYPLAALVFSL